MCKAHHRTQIRSHGFSLSLLVCVFQIKLYVTAPVDGECRVPNALAKAIATPFDLTKGPMVQVTLIPVNNTQEHLLVISMHYAVTDGWSAGVLFKDVSAAYNTLKMGKGTAASTAAPHCHLLLPHFRLPDSQCIHFCVSSDAQESPQILPCNA